MVLRLKTRESRSPPGLPRPEPTQHTDQPTTNTPAGWSSPVARQAHNLKVRGSNPLPATTFTERANTPETAASSEAVLLLLASVAIATLCAISPTSSMVKL